MVYSTKFKRGQSPKRPLNPALIMTVISQRWLEFPECRNSYDVTDGGRIRRRRLVSGDDRVLMIGLHMVWHVRQRHRVVGVVHVSENRFGLLYDVRLFDDRHVWWCQMHFRQDHGRYESVRGCGVDSHRRYGATNHQCHL